MGAQRDAAQSCAMVDTPLKRRGVACHALGAAPAISSSQRGHPGVFRPKDGPPQV